MRCTALSDAFNEVCYTQKRCNLDGGIMRGGAWASWVLGGWMGVALAFGIEITSVYGQPTANFDCARADASRRPILSGPVARIESAHVVVHYTLDGVDATTVEYAQAVSEAAERSLEVQFNELGFAPPPPDCGLGGDDRLDIYIMHIAGGAIGQAVPEQIVGDNPHTPAVERRSAYSYLIIDNDMDFLEAAAAQGYIADPFDLVRITTAHEVHHAVQFGYDARNAYFGFYESGAVWLETLIYPDLTDAYEYTSLFQHPDLCLGSRADRRRVYAEWVLIDSLTRDFGLAAYEQLWQHLAVRDNLPGLYEGLEQLGTSVEAVTERMAIRNLLLDYPNSHRFAVPVTIFGEVRDAGTISSGQRGVQQQGVDYLRVAAGVWRFEVRSGRAIQLRLVGVRGQTATSYTLGRGATVDTRPYDAAYLIVHNTLRHRQTEDCYFTVWALDVHVGREDERVAPDSDLWSAVNYRGLSQVGGR